MADIETVLLTCFKNYFGKISWLIMHFSSPTDRPNESAMFRRPSPFNRPAPIPKGDYYYQNIKVAHSSYLGHALSNHLYKIMH